MFRGKGGSRLVSRKITTTLNSNKIHARKYTKLLTVFPRIWDCGWLFFPASFRSAFVCFWHSFIMGKLNTYSYFKAKNEHQVSINNSSELKETTALVVCEASVWLILAARIDGRSEGALQRKREKNWKCSLENHEDISGMNFNCPEGVFLLLWALTLHGSSFYFYFYLRQTEFLLAIFVF